MDKKNVGIKPEEPEIKKGRRGGAKEKTLFFNQLVQEYFNFYEKEFGLKPSFDGSSPRDFKCIVDSIKKRSEENSIVWDFDNAKIILETFLQFAIKDVWLKENFLLFNLNRQKDKIFFKIKSQSNGKQKSTTGFTREGVANEFSRRYQRE